MITTGSVIARPTRRRGKTLPRLTIRRLMLGIVLVALYVGGIRIILQPMSGDRAQAVAKIAVGSVLFLLTTILLVLPIALTDPSYRAEMARQEERRRTGASADSVGEEHETQQ